MFYRIRQFLMAVFSNISDEDNFFIEKYLNEVDRKYFNKLQAHEKKHCINVARYVLDNNPNLDKNLIRASLLHDIGKINSGLNPIFKGIIVIMNAISKKLTMKMQFIKPINVYYNHPYIGANIYKNIDPKIAYIIENHHDYNSIDPIIKMIQEADSNN